VILKYSYDGFRNSGTVAISRKTTPSICYGTGSASRLVAHSTFTIAQCSLSIGDLSIGFTCVLADSFNEVVPAEEGMFKC
jgi:hypothetical protein